MTGMRRNDDDAVQPWMTGSSAAYAAGSRLRWQAGQLEAIRQQALSVCLLSWESPAGSRFVAYLQSRAAAMAVSVTLLSTAALLADAHADALRRAEEASAVAAGQ
ncbi:hypothetical protein [Arthrobacter sp. Br18]|uniref:hypothetical protein n=1 Tax=Arthrobacter sp. Br18 TaxID=1312954 RepID=UPI0012DF20B0|nr:hypothetical protein [Arthrobacter sp. Br18]